MPKSIWRRHFSIIPAAPACGLGAMFGAFLGALGGVVLSPLCLGTCFLVSLCPIVGMVLGGGLVVHAALANVYTGSLSGATGGAAGGLVGGALIGPQRRQIAAWICSAILGATVGGVCVFIAADCVKEYVDPQLLDPTMQAIHLKGDPIPFIAYVVNGIVAGALGAYFGLIVTVKVCIPSVRTVDGPKDVTEHGIAQP